MDFPSNILSENHSAKSQPGDKPSNQLSDVPNTFTWGCDSISL